MGNVIKENSTPQLAIENTHKALPIENEIKHPDVIYDTSLENTLNKMKNNAGFFNIEERDNGVTIWNGFPFEKMDGKLKIIEKIYIITPGIQKVLTDTSSKLLKKLNDEDREIFIKILENLHFDNFKAIRGESKSGRYKHSKTNFKKTYFERSRKWKNYHTI